VELCVPVQDPGIDPSVYALLGSAAVMTGFCRMTISLVVILVELTEGTQYLLPIILVVMISKWTGDKFSDSLYEHLVILKGIPFLHSHPPKSYNSLLVTDVMATEVVHLTEIVSVSRVIKVLTETRHNGFPVVSTKDGTCFFSGMILRGQLLLLLNRRTFESDNWNEHAHLRYRDYAEFMQRKLPKVAEMEFTDRDLERTVDLRPYMNKSVVTVQNTFSFREVFQVFRTLGLRHLPVLNEHHEPVGIITRKDLM